MIVVLAYISIIAAAVLLVFLLLGIFGSDAGIDDADPNLDGGFGFFKPLLIFLAVGCWIMRYLLLLGYNAYMAGFTAIISGLITALLLAYVLRLLLRNQKNVNYELSHALGKKANVYLRIPEGGKGLITVEINGVEREIEAKSDFVGEIATGSEVLVYDEKDNVLWVHYER